MNKKLLNILILFCIGAIYLVPRLWQLNNKITFHLDQGLQLNEAYQMVKNHRPKLIGPMVTTKTFEGRAFFIGPFYTYILAALGIFLKWNPLLITSFLIIFEFLSLLLFILWLGKKFSQPISWLIFLLFATTPFLIEHSRFFWNPHFLLPLGFLLVYLLENKKYFLASIIWGFGFSFHYSAVLWFIPFLCYLLKNHEKLIRYFVLIPGFIVGDLPFFIFEIKHHFYNLVTMFLVFTNTNKAGEISAYYFVFPFAAFLALFLAKLFCRSAKAVLIVILLLFLFNIFYFLKLREKIPVGMPSGWNYPLEQKVVKLILAEGCPKDFNIASTISGDTRFNDLRYLLTIQNCPPLGVEDYPQAQKLFLISPPDRPPEKETVWEVGTFKPFKIKKSISLNQYVNFYELERNIKEVIVK